MGFVLSIFSPISKRDGIAALWARFYRFFKGFPFALHGFTLEANSGIDRHCPKNAFRIENLYPQDSPVFAREEYPMDGSTSKFGGNR